MFVVCIQILGTQEGSSCYMKFAFYGRDVQASLVADRSSSCWKSVLVGDPFKNTRLCLQGYSLDTFCCNCQWLNRREIQTQNQLRPSICRFVWSMESSENAAVEAPKKAGTRWVRRNIPFVMRYFPLQFCCFLKANFLIAAILAAHFINEFKDITVSYNVFRVR